MGKGSLARRPLAADEAGRSGQLASKEFVPSVGAGRGNFVEGVDLNMRHQYFSFLQVFIRGEISPS